MLLQGFYFAIVLFLISCVPPVQASCRSNPDGTENCTRVMQGIWYGLGAALLITLVVFFTCANIRCRKIKQANFEAGFDDPRTEKPRREDGLQLYMEERRSFNKPQSYDPTTARMPSIPVIGREDRRHRVSYPTFQRQPIHETSLSAQSLPPERRYSRPSSAVRRPQYPPPTHSPV